MSLTLPLAVVDDVEVAVGEGEVEGTAEGVEGEVALGEALAHDEARGEDDVLQLATLGGRLARRVQDADAVRVNQSLAPRLCQGNTRVTSVLMFNNSYT